MVIPSVLNRAIPQDSSDASSTEKDIDILTTTVVPDLPSSESENTLPSISTDDIFASSTTEDTSLSLSTRTPSRQKPHVLRPFHESFSADLKNDYDMFLDFVNHTSQFKLELFDRTLMEVEKELRPGTPLMRVVDWVLNAFTQLQNNNNRRRKPNNGNSD